MDSQVICGASNSELFDSDFSFIYHENEITMDWFNNARKLIWTYLREDMNDSDLQRTLGTPREESSTDDLLLWCTNIQDIGTLRSEEHSSSSDVNAQVCYMLY